MVIRKRAAAWPVEVIAALQQAAAKRKATHQAMKDDEANQAVAVSSEDNSEGFIQSREETQGQIEVAGTRPEEEQRKK